VGEEEDEDDDDEVLSEGDGGESPGDFGDDADGEAMSGSEAVAEPAVKPLSAGNLTSLAGPSCRAPTEADARSVATRCYKPSPGNRAPERPLFSSAISCATGASKRIVSSPGGVGSEFSDGDGGETEVVPTTTGINQVPLLYDM